MIDFGLGLKKKLPFCLENKKFGCQTKFFVPNSIITDSGFGWVDRTRGFELTSTQPIPDRKNWISHWSRVISQEQMTDHQ
ncbi:hypothetical protein QUA56_05160 [Microcoleus sp. N3A4]|uniref:hypothetical protein n=1 Tax=Microcoleus sp. N3A4 TaxID=3055379 RepID=UPI002FD5FB94